MINPKDKRVEKLIISILFIHHIRTSFEISTNLSPGQGDGGKNKAGCFISVMGNYYMSSNKKENKVLVEDFGGNMSSKPHIPSLNKI